MKKQNQKGILFNALIEIGYTKYAIENAYNALNSNDIEILGLIETKLKGIFSKRAETKCYLLIKKLILLLDNTLEEEKIDKIALELYSKLGLDKMTLNVFEIFIEKGYDRFIIEDSIKCLTKERYSSLSEYSGGNIFSPNAVSRENVNYAVLKASLKRLEEIIISKTYLYKVRENSSKQNSDLMRKAQSVLFQHQIEGLFLSQRDALIAVLHLGLVDEKVYSDREISEIVKVSTQYIKRSLTSNEKALNNILDLISTSNAKLTYRA